MTRAYTEDELFHAIFGQESGFGKNTTTSPKDAHGPMQITPGAWAEYVKPGENLHIDNYDDNITVGKRIIHDLYTRYGGDPGRVATGYFSGKGNVAPMAFNAPYKSDFNDGKTKTSEYVNGIMARLGVGPAPATTAAPAAAAAALPAAQTPKTPAPADPWEQARSALGTALSSISGGFGTSASGGSRVIDPVYSPGPPPTALSENFATPTANPVPAKFIGGGSLAPQLGALAMTPQVSSYVDPSITQGAPSMTAMVQSGSPTDPTYIDPRRTGAISPYPRAFSRLG